MEDMARAEYPAMLVSLIPSTSNSIAIGDNGGRNQYNTMLDFG